MGSKGSTRQRAWSARLGPDYEDRFDWLWAEGYRTLPQMMDHWAKEHGRPDEPPVPEREPSEGTFKDRLRRHKMTDTDPWALSQADPSEVAAVMPVLAAVIQRTEGRVAALTKKHAALVFRIRAAAPDIDPWYVYRFALAYQRREAAGRDSGDLDAALALAPWRDQASGLALTPLAYGSGSQWTTTEAVPPGTPRQHWELFRYAVKEGGQLVEEHVVKAAVEGLWLLEELFRERQGLLSKEDTEEAEDGTQRK